MRKKIAAACCLATVLSTTAWAADYTFEGPDGGLFARPTSDETIYVDQKEVNVDRSKTRHWSRLPSAALQPICRAAGKL